MVDNVSPLLITYEPVHSTGAVALGSGLWAGATTALCTTDNEGANVASVAGDAMDRGEDDRAEVTFG